MGGGGARAKQSLPLPGVALVQAMSIVACRVVTLYELRSRTPSFFPYLVQLFTPSAILDSPGGCVALQPRLSRLVRRSSLRLSRPLASSHPDPTKQGCHPRV
ncbi:hypothetical protein BU24DRAFT_421684 [Aaosphaeria arxii CBS 175.79]|uniref:Uncharacterized protein n=1 Tax=Aaosphaeria arxii CBS 175.79 TaxID=1450172 RepID=A0A6A5XR74_9PLEO|nr:uncharacterized protein BU24DRAFT_421684 [Aaosphaeria arxii CBS 175.79]KAF2015396.1 hypothetical protein BU24DRAFT_421684 [Aaosphaeria arxii CBS 175.79]